MNLSTPLELEEITDVADLTRLEAEWNDLWARCPEATSFQRPEWLMAWMKTFDPGPLCTLAVRSCGHLVALAPLYIQQKGTERILASVGAAVSDYLDWLLDPECREQALEFILGGLHQLRTAWTRLDLSDVPGTSALLNPNQPQRYQTHVQLHDACPVLHLPPTLEELKKIIPRHQWRSVQSARSKIHKAGDARIELATPGTLEQLLESLFQLHRARWASAGVDGVLSDREVQNFHRCITPVLLRKSVLRLYALRFNHQIVAALYALFERDTAYCYLQGFDPQFAEFSPGAQILAAVIEDAVHHRKRSIDFLRGQEGYKYAWGARDVPTYRLQLSRTQPRPDLTAEQIAV